MRNHVLTCDGISNGWMLDKVIKSKKGRNQGVCNLDYGITGVLCWFVKRGCTMIVYMILRICDIKNL